QEPLHLLHPTSSSTFFPPTRSSSPFFSPTRSSSPFYQMFSVFFLMFERHNLIHSRSFLHLMLSFVRSNFKSLGLFKSAQIPCLFDVFIASAALISFYSSGIAVEGDKKVHCVALNRFL
ncbi:hypothetical protein AABB24_023537, partial [Solanum stoloniferum]